MKNDAVTYHFLPNLDNINFASFANLKSPNKSNEADFRKCPAVITKVMLDGKDVTGQTILPADPFPPDLHNYETDGRSVVVKNVKLRDGKQHRFDIEFKRLEPLRPSLVPDEYFETQSFSFDVQHGVPYEIDREDGLQGGACVLYAGLRNRPETSEIIQRYNSVTSADPSIPVYAYPHEGTKPAVVHQLAGCNDFILTGQLNPLIPSTFGKSQKFFEHVRYMRDLPSPWASSVIIDNDHQPSPKDLEWLTWAAIGAGSHGVLLTAHEKGDLRLASECEEGVNRILQDVKSLKSILGIGLPVDLRYSCNQEGIHVDFLACGPDHLLAVILNEWSTRSSFQESEPFMAAMRKGVEIKFMMGDWIPSVAIDPINRCAASFSSEDKDTVLLPLSCFDNVQAVLLSRNNERKTLHDRAEISTVSSQEPPVVFLNNAVVSLGTVRPSSSQTIEIPIQSLIDNPLVLTGENVSNTNSKPGETQLSEVRLEPKATGAISITYTAPMQTGKSVTHIRLTSKEFPEQQFSIYICAEVENPAELSQTMVDFGFVPVGTKSPAKEIKLKSSNANASIVKATSDNDAISDLVISEDKKSFTFSAHKTEVGSFTSQITAEIQIDNGETFMQTIRCTGQAQAIVFATPPQVSVIITDQPKKYTVGMRSEMKTPISISMGFVM